MVTTREVLPIAWSIYWKYALSAVVAGPIIGGVLGFIIGFLFGASPTVLLVIQVSAVIFAAVAAFFLFCLFLARTIGKEIRGKKLELVSTSHSGGN